MCGFCLILLIGDGQLGETLVRFSFGVFVRVCIVFKHIKRFLIVSIGEYVDRGVSIIYLYVYGWCR